MNDKATCVVCDFYENVWEGVLVLVVPMMAWILILGVVLVLILSRVRLRIGLANGIVFVLSFGLVGGVAGEVAGATLESIVGASLAAILGLVSSLLAYLFGKETLRAWRPVIPIAIIALLTSTLVGLVIGGSRRTQVIYEQRQADHAKFQFENLEVPTERERLTAFYKKCIAERTALDAANECRNVSEQDQQE